MPRKSVGGPKRENVAEVIAQLMWGPKTTQQIVEATGNAEMTVRVWLKAFHMSGLIRVHERRLRNAGEGFRQFGKRCIVWEWQNKPFAEEDVSL